MGFCVASLAGRGVAEQAVSSFGLGLRCGERECGPDPLKLLSPGRL